MKIQLTFKTPDVVDQLADLDDETRLIACRQLDKYVMWDQDITVELDTETGKLVVLRK